MSREPAAAPGKRGPRPQFTRDEVLAAALRVIDDSPPKALTMRRVADELGMGVMTLYGYVSSKEEMLEGVSALVTADAHRAAASATTWDDRLRAEARGLRDFGSRHPNLVTLVLAQGSPASGMFRMSERMLAALTDAGVTGTAALHSLGVLCSYALGFAAAQAGAAPLDLPERIRELAAEDFPHLSGLAANYGEHLSDEAFEFGLELLIAGLRAQIDEGAPRIRP